MRPRAFGRRRENRFYDGELKAAFAADLILIKTNINQKGVQLRQGGALFLWASGGETRIEGAETLVPSFARNGSGEIGYVESLKMYSGVMGLGYGHLFPLFSRFYFTASAFLAAGLNYNETDLMGRTDGQWAGVHRLSARAGAGYNYGNHVSGHPPVRRGRMLRITIIGSALITIS